MNPLENLIIHVVVIQPERPFKHVLLALIMENIVLLFPVGVEQLLPCFIH